MKAETEKSGGLPHASELDESQKRKFSKVLPKEKVKMINVW